jgi:hypothetical protein
MGTTNWSRSTAAPFPAIRDRSLRHASPDVFGSAPAGLTCRRHRSSSIVSNPSGPPSPLRRCTSEPRSQSLITDSVAATSTSYLRRSYLRTLGRPCSNLSKQRLGNSRERLSPPFVAASPASRATSFAPGTCRSWPASGGIDLLQCTLRLGAAVRWAGRVQSLRPRLHSETLTVQPAELSTARWLAFRSRV